MKPFAVALPDARDALDLLLDGLGAECGSSAPTRERVDRLRADAIRILFLILARCAESETGPEPSEWRRALAELADGGRAGAGIQVGRILDESPLKDLYRTSARDFSSINLRAFLLSVDRLSRGTSALGSREWTEFREIEPGDVGRIYESLRSFEPTWQFDDATTRTPASPRDIDESRKASGCYYTPQPIVRHIVRTALTSLGRCKETNSQPWLPVSPCARGEGKMKASELIEAPRILDPAMGCGYFLLAAAELLDDMRAGNEGSDGDSDPAILRLRRSRIAASCLFGVDKDPVAVDLARLAIMAWVEGRLTTAVIPELTDALRVGDSLIGDPPERFACPDTRERKSGLEAGRGFHWQEEFRSIFDSGSRPEAGFDAVVGNPPYDNSRGGLVENPGLSALSGYARKCGHYRISGAVDLYRLFIQRALQLCRNGGVVSMIVPRSLLGDRDAAQERKLLLSETEIISIDEFPYDDSVRRVFRSAALATCIVTCRKGGPTQSFPMARWPDGRMSGAPYTSVQRRDALERFWPDNVPLVSWSKGEWSAIDHLAAAEWICPLSEISDAGIGEANSGYHKSFMVDYDTGSLLVRGSDVSAYFIGAEGTHKRWIDAGGYLETLTPLARERLRSGEARVAKQAVRNINSPKRLVAALTSPGWFLADSTDYFVAKPPYDSRYLLVLLNSRSVPEWIFKRISTNNNVNLYQVRDLPVPRVCFNTRSDLRARRAEEGWRLAAGLLRTEDDLNSSNAALDHRSAEFETVSPATLEEVNDWVERSICCDPFYGSGIPDYVHDLLVRLAQEMIDLKQEIHRGWSDYSMRATLANRTQIAENLIDSIVWRAYRLRPTELDGPMGETPQSVGRCSNGLDFER